MPSSLQACPPVPSPLALIVTHTRLTMDDEVDLSGVGLVAGLEGAGVEALITKSHLGDEDGEFLGGVDEQPHPGVTGPTVIARIQDVGTV